jgi:acyl transferase domain-containing protein
MGLENSPFPYSFAGQPWEGGHRNAAPRGVSGFGFGGTNAHVLIEEWRRENNPDAKLNRGR